MFCRWSILSYSLVLDKCTIVFASEWMKQSLEVTNMVSCNPERSDYETIDILSRYTNNHEIGSANAILFVSSNGEYASQYKL